MSIFTMFNVFGKWNLTSFDYLFIKKEEFKMILPFILNGSLIIFC